MCIRVPFIVGMGTLMDLRQLQHSFLDDRTMMNIEQAVQALSRETARLPHDTALKDAGQWMLDQLRNKEPDEFEEWSSGIDKYAKDLIFKGRETEEVCKYDCSLMRSWKPPDLKAARNYMPRVEIIEKQRGPIKL